MLASKIGSANTYTRCLKELDAWGYLKYNPSYNPHLGSMVYMYTFDKSRDKGGDKGSVKGTDKGSVIAVIPYINSLNNINSINKRKRENNLSLTNETSYEKSKKKIQVATKTSIPKKRKKIAAKKEIKETKPSVRAESRTGATKTTDPSVKRRLRPLLLEVQNFFKANAWPVLEAEKYFNHYQSNGWLVGGKTPMSDWQASATKWMLNSTEFKKQIVTPGLTEKLKPGNLNTITNKNYDEPL
jgi:hypothetical protein